MMKTDFNIDVTIAFCSSLLIKTLKIGSQQEKSHFSEFEKFKRPGLNRHSRSNYGHFHVRVCDENMTNSNSQTKSPEPDEGVKIKVDRSLTSLRTRRGNGTSDWGWFEINLRIRKSTQMPFLTSSYESTLRSPRKSAICSIYEKKARGTGVFE